MSEPFLAELRLFSFNFAPKGWAMCNGQLLAIQANAALFSLLGTMYGGDGIRTFALPNLQGRVPAHVGTGYVQGQLFGEPAHTLLITEMAMHNHIMGVNSSGVTGPVPTDAVYGDTGAVAGLNAYSTIPPSKPMNAGVISITGGSQPHNNEQPYLVLNYCIALQGIFPSRS